MRKVIIILALVLTTLICYASNCSHSWGDWETGNFSEIENCKVDKVFGIKTRSCEQMRSCSKCGDNEYKKCGDWSSCKPFTPGT